MNGSDTGRVLPRSHGFDLDHIALAASDTARGVAWLAERTGAAPLLVDPEPSQWYQSATLPLGGDSFLEVIGPNPSSRRPHPLRTLLAGFDEPRLLFWYVATDDLDAFSARAADGGHLLTRVECVDGGEGHNKYRRAVIGKGFVSQRPSVIEWQRRVEREDLDHRCRLTGFDLWHPEPGPMNDLLQHIGASIQVTTGESRIELVVDSPAGEVRLESPGFEATPVQMGRGLLRGLLRRR